MPIQNVMLIKQLRAAEKSKKLVHRKKVHIGDCLDEGGRIGGWGVLCMAGLCMVLVSLNLKIDYWNRSIYIKEIKGYVKQMF